MKQATAAEYKLCTIVGDLLFVVSPIVCSGLVFGHCFVLQYLYLRNLPTHTVYNLLQKLYYVNVFQYFVVKQKFNIIHIMCENFRTIP